jgi:hypothetical protein
MRFHQSEARFRRRYLVIPILLTVLAVVVAVHSGTLNQPTAQRAASPLSPHCRTGNPLEGVYAPLQLRIVSSCEVASGVVESVTPQDDGDERIYVRLDGQHAKLLAAGTSNYQNAMLVLELIPKDRATVPVPNVGQHISFVGPLVYDSESHWNAIWPVWWIQGD